MVIDVNSIGEEIGVVLSRSSSSLAPVLLRRDKETNVHEEDLAIIVDESLPGYYMFGIIRWITRHEPFLRQGSHNIYVEYPEALTKDIVMPFSNAFIEIYGAFCENEKLCESKGFVTNTYAPHPSSKVYKVIDASVFTSYLSVDSPLYLARHKYSGWLLPLDSHWLPYHVGVFGATGTGKSRLIMGLVSSSLTIGYSFIVFDHTGVDYAPYASLVGIPVIPASEIKIPVIVFSQALSELMGLQSSSLRDYVDAAVICHDMLVAGKASNVNDCFSQLRSLNRNTSLESYQKPRKQSTATWSKSDFLKTLIQVASKLGGRDTTIFKLRFLVENMVPDYVLDRMGSRSKSIEEVIDLAWREGAVIIDLSSEQDIEIKRSIVSTIVREGWKSVLEGTVNRSAKSLGLGIVVDEAQNYACEYCSSSGRDLETIAREGRKWGYFLVVASQRIARDIRPGIRSNLGTVFFSKLQSSSDLQELSGYMDLGRLTEASLTMLSRQEFFVAGLMNPLRRPILVKVEDVKGFSKLA